MFYLDTLKFRKIAKNVLKLSISTNQINKMVYIKFRKLRGRNFALLNGI